MHPKRTTSHPSEQFVRTRAAHQSELAEDYVEVMLDLIEEQGEAKLTAISARLGVAHPTVSKTLRRLEGEGLVEILPYRSIVLTRQGLALAEACRRRHSIVFEFLQSIGVDRATAAIDAEGIEHHVSERTLLAMERVTRTRK